MHLRTHSYLLPPSVHRMIHPPFISFISHYTSPFLFPSFAFSLRSHHSLCRSLEAKRVMCRSTERPLTSSNPFVRVRSYQDGQFKSRRSRSRPQGDSSLHQARFATVSFNLVPVSLTPRPSPSIVEDHARTVLCATPPNAAYKLHTSTRRPRCRRVVHRHGTQSRRFLYHYAHISDHH